MRDKLKAMREAKGELDKAEAYRHAKETMTPNLARRALRVIIAALDGTDSKCRECHCPQCRREAPHECSITRTIDDLRRASRGEGAGRP